MMGVMNGTDEHLGRCPERGCPVRWRSGRDQRCLMHDDALDGLGRRASEFAELMTPGAAWQGGNGKVLRADGRQ